MKKQSILAILIAALLVLTVFTGCAANSKMAPAAPASMDSSYYDSTQEAAAAETPMEAPAEPEEEFAYDTVATTEAGSAEARLRMTFCTPRAKPVQPSDRESDSFWPKVRRTGTVGV